MDEQIEKLKIIYENSRSHYEEATFKRPARVVDRGFRWAGIYVLTFAIIPQYLETSVSFGLSQWNLSHYLMTILEVIAAGLSLIAFFLAIRNMMFVLRYREYDWVNPQDLTEISGNLPLEKFYGALSERFIDCCLTNFESTQHASRYLARSNRWFYGALFIGLLVYVSCKLLSFYF